MIGKHIRIGIIALSALLPATINAQTPQRVQSITVERYNESWYKEQLSLWEKLVEKNSKDAEAWYNYFAAARALKNISEVPEETEKYTKLCHEIADKAIIEIPETFEANHLYWWDGGNQKDRYKYLFKAYEINPNDPRTFDDLLVVYEIERNTAEFDKMAKKMIDVNALAPGILNWGYNLLSELDNNAIVFSAGDNDTYALWLIQSAFGFRKDVRVLNVHLFSFVPEYREKCLKELKITNFKSPEPEDNEAMLKCLNEMVRFSTDKNPVYISGSANYYLDLITEKDSFYLTGLAYKYCKQSFDNVSLIRRNYENRYKVDYLDIQFSNHVSDQVAIQFDALYLPSLIKLYRHYDVSEETQKRDESLALLKRIGERTGREERVESLLNSDQD